MKITLARAFLIFTVVASILSLLRALGLPHYETIKPAFSHHIRLFYEDIFIRYNVEYLLPEEMSMPVFESLPAQSIITDGAILAFVFFGTAILLCIIVVLAFLVIYYLCKLLAILLRFANRIQISKARLISKLFIVICYASCLYGVYHFANVPVVGMIPQCYKKGFHKVMNPPTNQPNESIFGPLKEVEIDGQKLKFTELTFRQKLAIDIACLSFMITTCLALIISVGVGTLLLMAICVCFVKGFSSIWQATAYKCDEASEPLDYSI